MKGMDEVKQNLKGWERRMTAAINGLSEHYAAKGESYAKQNAPWQDRTSHARQGLFGYVLTRDENLFIRYAHTMDYGVYLELCNQGLYAILEPTAKKLAPEFFRDVRRLTGK